MDSVLAKHLIVTGAADVSRQYIAAAIYTGFADPELITKNEKLTPFLAAEILCNVAEVTGKGRQYIRRIEGTDILHQVVSLRIQLQLCHQMIF